MPKLSYPGGRKAAAQEAPLKTSSVKLTDGTGANLVTMLEEEEQPKEEILTPEPDEASIAFQKQIDALRESERIQRERADQLQREREDAIKRANEREAEIHSLKKTTVESHLEALDASLAAAQAEEEAARNAIEKAQELGDFKAFSEAMQRLSKAQVNAAHLESGRASLEEQVKAAAETKVEKKSDALDNYNIPELAKNWLRKHPEYLNNPRKNAKIQDLHYDIIDEGHEPYSLDYFISMEQHLGMREKPRVEPEGELEETVQERSRNVSAPVSRDNPPSSSGERPGRITLSLAQKEAAKIAGITEREYAENLLKLRAEKLNGNYGGAP